MNRVSRGKGFAGVVGYVLSADRDGGAGRLIGGNLASSTSSDIAREFRSIAKIRPDVKKPVWHFAIRMPPGEDVSDEKWREIVDDLLSENGMSGCPFIIAKHDDEAAAHVVACRVRLDGSLHIDKNENLRLTRILGQLEIKHNLTRTKQAPELPVATKRKPAKRAIDRFARTGELPVLSILQSEIDAAIKLSGGNDLEFSRLLQSRGVALKFRIDDSEIRGVSYIYKGMPVSGSKLGRRYTLPGLLSRGIGIDPKNFGAASINLSGIRRTEFGGLEGFGKTKPGSWSKFWLSESRAAANDLPDLIVREADQKIICYSDNDAAIEAMIHEAEQRFAGEYKFFGAPEFIAKCESVRERMKNEQNQRIAESSAADRVENAGRVQPSAQERSSSDISADVPAGSAAFTANPRGSSSRAEGGESVEIADRIFEDQAEAANSNGSVANNSIIHNTVNTNISNEEIKMNDEFLTPEQNAQRLRKFFPGQWADFYAKNYMVSVGRDGKISTDPRVLAPGFLVGHDEIGRAEKFIFVNADPREVAAIRCKNGMNGALVVPVDPSEKGLDSLSARKERHNLIREFMSRNKQIYNYSSVPIPGSVTPGGWRRGDSVFAEIAGGVAAGHVNRVMPPDLQAAARERAEQENEFGRVGSAPADPADQDQEDGYPSFNL